MSDDLIQLLGKIQNPETTHVDLYKRRGLGSLQWFLEKDCTTHPVHDNNDLRFYMCGKEGFAAIAQDIRRAKDIRIKGRVASDNQAQNAKAEQDAQANAKSGRNQGQANDIDTERRDEARIKPGRYREIYIHSKLLLVDDVYTTLGSANLNARSMVGDSEFNISTEQISFTQGVRKRVWGNLAGDDLDGKTGSREDVALTFKDWAERMRKNKESRLNGSAPVNGSFIHPFEDPRSAPPFRFA